MYAVKIGKSVYGFHGKPKQKNGYWMSSKSGEQMMQLPKDDFKELKENFVIEIKPNRELTKEKLDEFLSEHPYSQDAVDWGEALRAFVNLYKEYRVDDIEQFDEMFGIY